MLYIDFISSLNDEDRENYNKFSKIRGTQQYKIIYETLLKIDSNITYKDVNSFIRYDKALKDVLFKYLGTLEEYIKNDILLNFDFSSDAIIKKEDYHFFDKLPKCIEKSQPKYEITEFYKRFALNFRDIVSFVREYCPNKFDVNKLDDIVYLRNAVMHHSPLLFSYNFESTKDITMIRIKKLIELLPLDYPKYIISEINERTEKTTNNINNSFICLLLDILKEV